jgi:hypothetical protein
MFKRGDGCIMLWVYLESARSTEFFGGIKTDGIELNKGKNKTWFSLLSNRR